MRSDEPELLTAIGAPQAACLVAASQLPCRRPLCPARTTWSRSAFSGRSCFDFKFTDQLVAERGHAKQLAGEQHHGSKVDNVLAAHNSSTDTRADAHQQFKLTIAWRVAVGLSLAA